MGPASSPPADDFSNAAHAVDEPGVALAAAREVGGSFTKDKGGDPLSPEVRVSLDVGSDDQPLFVFSLLVDLPDDLAPDAYSLKDIVGLEDELRGRITGSPVDDWSWLVTTGTKAGAGKG